MSQSQNLVVPWESFMNKIRQYFSTLEITRGLVVALLSSAFIYLSHWGLSYTLPNTFLGLISLYILLGSNPKTWFITGAFTGLFWFWWIARSLIYYEMLWAVPLELMIIMLSYAFLFGSVAWISEKISKRFSFHTSLLALALKAVGLLTLSLVHPFGFDWLKPELIFAESYLGIQKWQFAIVLLAIVLSLWKKHPAYLFLVVFAYQPTPVTESKIPDNITLVTTHTKVKDKWNETLHHTQFNAVFRHIDQAIKEKKSLIIFPESVFPIFLNRSEKNIAILEEKAKHLSIVIGGLYWDEETPRNSTYIFTDGKIQIANKVVLVPFGESNPLPDFLSNWVNEVFYDGAVDYIADKDVIDYQIDGITYRNAICFEGTSEKLYEGRPKNMILLSNNGWFTPSIEPTLQKLLLQYYNKKYGTTIYHSVNMSNSYMIKEGKVVH